MSKPGPQQVKSIGNRFAPARFVIFLLLLPAVFFAYRALLPPVGWKDGVAVAFDIAALVFLASLVPLLRECDAADIRAHAAANDANRGLILLVTTLLTLVVMAAITGEMAGAQRGETLAIAKLIGTLLMIWLFANAVFTLHYTHAYYSRDPKDGSDIGGLDFPGEDTPDYTDFGYFAFTLGMTFQTSDVDITGKGVRRVALLHSFAAFVFNIGVIAFTINVLGGGS